MADDKKYVTSFKNSSNNEQFQLKDIEAQQKIEELKNKINYIDTKQKNLKYYGNENITASNSSLFEFTKESGYECTIKAKIDGTNWNDITELVIPYEYYDTEEKTSYLVIGIEEEGFSNLSRLEKVTIPNSIYYIENKAFYNCENLENIVLPKDLSEIGNYCFYGCEYLHNIIIPEQINQIGNYCFYGCSFIREIVIPSAVLSIGEYAFSNCTQLHSLTILNNNIDISPSAFNNCNILKHIYCGVGSSAYTYFRSDHDIHFLEEQDILYNYLPLKIGKTYQNKPIYRIYHNQDISIEEITSQILNTIPLNFSNIFILNYSIKIGNKYVDLDDTIEQEDIGETLMYYIEYVDLTTNELQE